MVKNPLASAEDIRDVGSIPGLERLKAREGTTEDEMVRWHHQLDGHEFE